MNGNQIIVHSLITYDDKVMVTKRSKNEDTYPEYWDIPGGLANIGEMPRDAVIRETKEEVNLDIVPTEIIHEDSNYDLKKDTIFIRLVYACKLKSDISNIEIDQSEHSEYRLINKISDLDGELISPFLQDILTQWFE